MNLKHILFSLCAIFLLNSSANARFCDHDIIPIDGAIEMEVDAKPAHGKPYSMVEFNADYKICLKNLTPYEREIVYLFRLGSTEYAASAGQRRVIVSKDQYCASTSLTYYKYYDPKTYSLNPVYAIITANVLNDSVGCKSSSPISVIED